MNKLIRHCDAALVTWLKCCVVFYFPAVFFSHSVNSFIQTTLQIKFAHDGICHGFAVWIDWVLDEKNPIVISTGPGKDYAAHPYGTVY